MMTKVLVIDNNLVMLENIKKNFNAYLLENGKSIEVEVLNPGTWAGNDNRYMLECLEKNEYNLYLIGHSVGIIRKNDIDQKAEEYGCKVKYLRGSGLEPTKQGYERLVKIIEESVWEDVTS